MSFTHGIHVQPFQGWLITKHSSIGFTYGYSRSSPSGLTIQHWFINEE